MSKTFTPHECKQFLNNPTINPKTNRPIKKNGPTYKKINAQCGKEDKKIKKVVKKIKKVVKKIKKVDTKNKKIAKESLMKGKCDLWKTNKTVNPLTNRKIKDTGAVYKQFAKLCKDDVRLNQDLKRIRTSIRRVTSSYKDSSPDLIIRARTRRYIDTDTQLLGGTKLTELIMIMYLLKKHKEDINLFLRKDFKKLFKQINTNQLTLKDIRTLDYTILFEIESNGGKGRTPNLHFPLKDKGMTEYFGNIKKDPDIRFTFFLVSLYSAGRIEGGREVESAWGHANFIVYDKLDNTAYRFEPNGGSVDFYDSESVDASFAQKFNKYGVRYQSMNQFCPYIIRNRKEYNVGPQTMEDVREILDQDPGGFCAYWSIYFIDFIMSNYKKDKYKNTRIDEFLALMMTGIGKKFRSYKQFIRTFAVYINDAAINIGESKDIDAYIDKMINEI